MYLAKELIAMRIKLTMFAIIFCSVLFTSNVALANDDHEAVNVIIDGNIMEANQSAVRVDGRVLVPLRTVFEQLGATVTWDQHTKTATGIKGDTKVIVRLDHKTAYVNDRAFTLDVPAQTINNRTMVPLRFVAESLGAEVKWDGTTKTATITSPSASGVPAPQEPQQEPPQQDQQDQQKQSQQEQATERKFYIGDTEVLYGHHKYGSRTEDEYNEVVRIVREAFDTQFEDIQPSEEGIKYMDMYLAGNRWDGDIKSRDRTNRELKNIEDSFGSLFNNGVSKEEVIKLARLWTLAVRLSQGNDPRDGSPRSAYDALVRGVRDCDATANVYSLVFDMAGYNTAIIANKSHAYMIVEINGEWYSPTGGQFTRQVGLPTSTRYRLNEKVYFYETPTDFYQHRDTLYKDIR